MSGPPTETDLVTRVRPIAPSPPGRLGSVVVVGAWLALTILFAIGGVALVLTVAAALGQPQGMVSFAIAFAGALVAHGAAPTMARVAVVSVVERLDDVLEEDAEDDSSSLRLGSSDTNKRGHCQSPGACCC